MSDTADHSSPDESIDTHPDLIDPEWNERVEREARKAVKRSSPIRPQSVEPARPGRRRRFALNNRSLSAILGVLILVGLFVLVNRVSEQNSSTPAQQPQGAIPIGNAGPAPTPTSRQNARLDLNAPFADTPAAAWADGAAGIQPPPATAVGKWSAATVAGAEASVKQSLVDAHLDPAMLVNHDPATYLASLAPNARADEQSRINSAQSRVAGTVSWLAAGFHLLSVPVKVDGSMTPATDPKTGDLVIHTNYVFAFAFDPGQAKTVSQPWQIIAVQHVAEDFTVVSGSGLHTTDKGLWVTSENGYLDQIGCTESGQGFIAPAFADGANLGAPRSTENPDALYAPSHALNIANSCPAPPQHA
ncbi:MAG TPA: hypothetical protein VJ914_21760 [Pseudonocardiaceae bacterium]|nr:hypothetical protein [Pseudonocardiaceae bacterium]